MPSEALDDQFYNDLDASLEQAWTHLARGATDRRSGFHTVQLASIGLDGAPRVRTVVLRGVDHAARQLRVHTDRRSVKFAELSARPEVEICAYDPPSRIQIRAHGRAELVTAQGADPAWDASEPTSRVCYRMPAGPGTPLEDPASVSPEPANSAEPYAGREHFAVIRMAVTRVDWLYLAARGHRRALFEWEGTAWRGGWLVP
jgi:pyridoxamine 5'-phosphate oxidase